MYPADAEVGAQAGPGTVDEWSMSPSAGRPTSGRVNVRAIVECLLAAHYTEGEILDYLIWPLGLTEADAFAALEAVRVPVRSV
jgi:hypothetical protein